MELEYFYCGKCGCELNNEFISYSRTCASGDLYFCPCCGEESLNIKEKKDKYTQ